MLKAGCYRLNTTFDVSLAQRPRLSHGPRYNDSSMVIDLSREAAAVISDSGWPYSYAKSYPRRLPQGG